MWDFSVWIIFRFRFWINLHNWCVTEVQETLIKWHLEWISAAGWHLGNWSRHWNALEFRDLNLKVLNMEITRSTETETHNACALFTLRLNKRCRVEQLIPKMNATEGVVSVEEL